MPLEEEEAAEFSWADADTTVDTPLGEDGLALLSQAKTLQETGNDTFKRLREHAQALELYEQARDTTTFRVPLTSRQALALLSHRQLVSSVDAKAAAATLRSNAAACCLALGRWADAERQCTLALRLDPRMAKALYRRTCARVELARRGEGSWNSALLDAQAALVVAPNDSIVAALFSEVEEEAGRMSKVGARPSVLAAEAATASESELSFHAGIVDELQTLLFRGDIGAVETEVRMLHHKEGGPETGRIAIDGAFQSCARLESACAFIRGLHIVGTDASAAVVIVPRSKVSFPLVWYAGSWPDELRAEDGGVFVELHTRAGVARTLFLTAAGDKVTLPADCALLVGDKLRLLA